MIEKVVTRKSYNNQEKEAEQQEEASFNRMSEFCCGFTTSPKLLSRKSAFSEKSNKHGKIEANSSSSDESVQKLDSVEVREKSVFGMREAMHKASVDKNDNEVEVKSVEMDYSKPTPTVRNKMKNVEWKKVSSSVSSESSTHSRILSLNESLNSIARSTQVYHFFVKIC